MPLSLIRANTWVNGGFAYTQDMGGGKTMAFDGNTPFKAQISRVLFVRQQNHLPRATWDEVSSDILNVVCGKNPGSCFESNSRPKITPRKVYFGCGSCGGRRAKQP